MGATAAIEGVGLEEYIRAKARLEHAPQDVAAVLEFLSLPDVEAWQRVERAWRERTESDARLASIVSEFFADYVLELRGEAPDEAASESDGEASAAPPIRQLVPSYMQAPAVAPPSHGPTPHPVTAPAPSPFAGSSPVLRTPAPAVGAAATAAQAPVSPLSRLDLRFAGLNQAGPDATLPPSASGGPSLPFAKGQAGESAADVLARARAASPVVAPVAAHTAQPSADETAFLPAGALADARLPFAPRGDATTKPDAGPSASAPPTAGEPLRAAPADGPATVSADTVALDESSVADALKTPTPWISLDEYARFLAELAAGPPDPQALRERYGIATEDAQRALGAGFAARFAKDPTERMQFNALLARYRKEGG